MDTSPNPQGGAVTVRIDIKQIAALIQLIGVLIACYGAYHWFTNDPGGFPEAPPLKIGFLVSPDFAAEGQRRMNIEIAKQKRSEAGKFVVGGLIVLAVGFFAPGAIKSSQAPTPSQPQSSGQVGSAAQSATPLPVVPEPPAATPTVTPSLPRPTDTQQSSASAAPATVGIATMPSNPQSQVSGRTALILGCGLLVLIVVSMATNSQKPSARELEMQREADAVHKAAQRAKESLRSYSDNLSGLNAERAKLDRGSASSVSKPAGQTSNLSDSEAAKLLIGSWRSGVAIITFEQEALRVHFDNGIREKKSWRCEGGTVRGTLLELNGRPANNSGQYSMRIVKLNGSIFTFDDEGGRWNAKRL